MSVHLISTVNFLSMKQVDVNTTVTLTSYHSGGSSYLYPPHATLFCTERKDTARGVLIDCSLVSCNGQITGM